MDSKIVQWFILLISIVFIIGGCFVLIKDLNFFTTRKETTAKIVSVLKYSNYKINLTYYNDYVEKEINVTVTLKNSYRDKVENFGESVSIYYSKLFPRNVYIANCKVPRKGIVVFELIFILIMCIAFKSGFDGVRRK